MKLVSYLNGGREQVGLLLHEEVFMLKALHPLIPATMEGLLENWDYYIGMAQRVELKLKMDPIKQRAGIPLKALQLLSPVPRPGSLRDGYAFRQHVLTARRNRGLEMTPVFDEFPVFYFGNHRTVCGPGIIECMPDVMEQLDYELEVAVVISKAGKNIRACQAEQYMAGLMIMNDFSARKLQMDEMQMSLGPAKGKDFATACGPWLVTMDELEPFSCEAPSGHVGKNWDLTMRARVDDGLLSVGNLADMHWTFAELIERASYGVELFPGDIIGSGTVGTGCFLELNGTHKLNDPEYVPQWLEAGEVVELEVDGLGVLRNEIVRAENDFSILDKKNKIIIN